MFDVTELTISRFHAALIAKETTCEEIVTTYLERIRTINPKLKAIIHTSQTILSDAKTKDEEFNRAGISIFQRQPLFGVPVILKDTYLTSDLPTTNGSKSFIGLTSKDAFIVTKLRSAGALILAKANCHEFCLQGCTFSSLGGQTLNPYDLTRTPGGSSGGTGSSIAANLGLVGCGGDTMNSIRSPASACCLVGFRPTNGMIGRSGIFPVAPTQDAAGPMTRTVEDCRTLFRVMRGRDEEDEATKHDDHDLLVPNVGDRRVRVGLLRGYFPLPKAPEVHPVQAVMDTAIAALKDSGVAEFVDIPNEYDVAFDYSTLLLDYDVQAFELRATFDEFLESHHILTTPHKTLESVHTGGQYDERALSQVWHNTLKSEFNMQCQGYRERLQKIEVLREKLAGLIESMNLDVICYPHQKRLVMKTGTRIQEDRNGLLTALTGLPSLCIPAGFSLPGPLTPTGVPVGMELVASPFYDDYLLDIGERFERILNVRQVPQLG